MNCKLVALNIKISKNLKKNANIQTYPIIFRCSFEKVAIKSLRTKNKPSYTLVVIKNFDAVLAALLNFKWTYTLFLAVFLTIW